jgi:enoyl-CoA hydratase
MMSIGVERTDTHWTVTLNRPEKLNAFSVDLVEQLISVFDQAVREDVSLVALRGEGRCFSAGFDMGDVTQHSDGDLLLRFVRIETLLQRVATFPGLTLALAHGRNFGAGVDLIAACKLRVAAPDATFRMPGLKFDLVLGTRRFASIVGVTNARRLLETSATFTAPEAASMGFVESVSAIEQWPTIMAQAIGRSAALSKQARVGLHGALHHSMDDADLAALVRSASEPGLGERIAAYLRG